MLCYMTGMPPTTSTHDPQGTLIDGKAHSAEWRERQRAVEQAEQPDASQASAGGLAGEFGAAAAKDFVSSLMIPASHLAGETRARPAAPEAPDAYIEKLLEGSRERQPTQELEADATASSARSEELDRWFEEQATSVPRAPAAQKLPVGSASLDLETAAGVGIERARRGRALGLRRASEEDHGQQRDRPASWRRLHSAVGVTRMWLLAATTLAVLVIVAIAVAAGGAPAHRSPRLSALESSSTGSAGVLDTFVLKAGRRSGAGSAAVRARQHRSPARGTDRAARRRPIAHRRIVTRVALSSSYTPRATSQADSSPPAAVSTSSSASSAVGGSPATSTGSVGASSPATNSAPAARTGPSGPISLIGAGTTPSG
jgi:hypothetical protein